MPFRRFAAVFAIRHSAFAELPPLATLLPPLFSMFLSLPLITGIRRQAVFHTGRIFSRCHAFRYLR